MTIGGRFTDQKNSNYGKEVPVQFREKHEVFGKLSQEIFLKKKEEEMATPIGKVSKWIFFQEKRLWDGSNNLE